MNGGMIESAMLRLWKGVSTIGGAQRQRPAFSELLDGSSRIPFADNTLSVLKQTLVVPVGSLTTFARSVNFSCDAAPSL